MGLFFRKDGSGYRAWVNVVLSLAFPGLGHFLSGRKRAGMVWFLMNFGICAAVIFLVISPFAPAVLLRGVGSCLALGLWLAAVIDSCRKPISRLKIGTWILVWVVIIGVVFVPGIIINSFFFKIFSIPTAAMEPTLMENRKNVDGLEIKGDRVVVDKWGYHFHGPQRGDVLVFRTSGIKESERERFSIPPDEFYVKRLVGLPGERISILPPYVYINGQKLLKPKIFATIASGVEGFQGFSTPNMQPGAEVQLGPDEYFILGDNARNSLDSRYFGPISPQSVIGKASWIYSPPERRHILE